MSMNHKTIGDVSSGMGVIFSWLGTLFHWLPEFLTLLVTVMGVAWYALQFYDWWRLRRSNKP